MAELTNAQKLNFKEYRMVLADNVGFIFNRETGISIMAEFTGPLKNHVRIVVSYCGPKDTFKKKLAFIECARKLCGGGGVIMPANSYNLVSECLDFAEFNFNDYSWEQF